jgi:TRAP-type C4-dicarboxylate transport system substrate-binding protein
MCAEHDTPSVDGTDERRCMTMQTRGCIQRAVAAGLVALATTVVACAGPSDDKAGGVEAAEPRVLSLANPNDGSPPAQIDSWADEVNRLSGGTLEIEFENGWRLGEPLYEAGTLEDVKAGKVEMGWVGSRVFDTVGVTSFQALGAPLLVDSYDLESAVFEAGIPEQMLEGVSELDLVGVGVLPGPMRKVLGLSKPFIRPGDFEGQVVGMQDSAVAGASLSALGATPRALPSGAELGGLDAYEQQLGSIAGNGYESEADYVTANVNLWPRPLVIVMGEEAFESLTDEQQSALRDAAAAAMPEALAAARAEDEEAVPMLCRRGLTFAAASEGDFAELRQAFEPVYGELAADAETKSNIDAITALKTEIAAPAESPVCDSDSGEPASSAEGSLIEGTYSTTVTREALEHSPLLYDLSEVNDQNWGELTLTFDQGHVTFEQENDVTSSSTSGTYEVDGDTIVLEFTEGVNAGETFAVRWSLFRDKLTFARDEALGIIPTPYLIEPWITVE